MDIIATRNSFGDFGRVKKRRIISDLQKSQAEKLIGSGAYRQATSEDHRAASDAKSRRIPNAKERATRKGDAAVDVGALQEQVAELREAMTTSLAALATAIQSVAVAVAKETHDAVSPISEAIAAINGRFDAVEKQLETLKAPAVADSGKK